MRFKQFPDCAKVQTIPLHFAITNRLTREVRRLVEGGADVNACDHNKRTALMLCCMEDNEHWGAGVARMLLQAGADAALCDVNGRNALMFAVIFQRTVLVDLLLNASEYNMTQRDVDGQTALHYAVLRDHPRIVYGVAKAYKAQYVGTSDALKAKQEHLWKEVMQGFDSNSKTKESTFYNPYGPEKPWKKIIREEKESTRVHMSSSAMNIHQFRRGAMYRFDVRSARKQRSESLNGRPLSSSANLSTIMNLSCRTPPVANPRPFTAHARSYRESVSRRRRNADVGPRDSSWRATVPLFWDVLKEQSAPSYRPAANPVPQTFEEALGLPPNDLQVQVEDGAEAESTARSSKSYTAQRRRSSSVAVPSSQANSPVPSCSDRVVDNDSVAASKTATNVIRNGLSDKSAKRAKGAEQKSPEEPSAVECQDKNDDGKQPLKSEAEISPPSSGSSTSLSLRPELVTLSRRQSLNGRNRNVQNRPGSAIRESLLPKSEKQTQLDRLAIPQPTPTKSEPGRASIRPKSSTKPSRMKDNMKSLPSQLDKLAVPQPTPSEAEPETAPQRPKSSTKPSTAKENTKSSPPDDGKVTIHQKQAENPDHATPANQPRPREDAAKRASRRPESMFFRDRVLSDILEENETPISPNSPNIAHGTGRKGGRDLRCMSAHVRGARANGRLSR